jgi:hypothetical protein
MTLMWMAIAVLSVFAVTVSVYARQLSKRVSLIENLFKQQISSLQHELTVINGAAIGVGQRLLNTEIKLKSAMEKQQKFERDSVEYLPFNHAVVLAESGADAQQLIDTCGLSEAEAALVTLMQTAASTQNKSFSHLN